MPYRSISFALVIALISAAAIGPSYSTPPALGVPSALADATSTSLFQQTEKKLPPVQIRPESIKINKKPPITFQPFPMIDPATGKQVTGDYMLTLPDKRKVQAAAYYAEVNRIEKELNQLGYSLRTMPKNLMLQESAVRQATLQPTRSARLSATLTTRAALASRFSGNQTLTTGQRVLPANELNPQTVTEIQAKFRQQTVAVADNVVKLVPSRIAIPSITRVGGPAPKPKIYHHEQPYDWGVGDPDKFRASINGKVITDGKLYPLASPSGADLYKSPTEFLLGATVSAGGAILGADVNLVGASANFHAPANTTKPLSVTMSLSVLGATVYSFNKNFASEKWGNSDTISQGLKVGVPFGVPLGPVIVGGEIGAKGSGGFEYGVSMSRAGVSGNVSPFVHTAVYGEGGASILIGGAGVGVEMTLLNADLHLHGNIRLGWFIKWLVFDELYADYDLEMLNGRVYAYAYVYYPCPKWTDPFDTCKKQWEHNFWKWSGFKDTGTLLDYKNVIAFDAW